VFFAIVPQAEQVWWIYNNPECKIFASIQVFVWLTLTCMN